MCSSDLTGIPNITMQDQAVTESMGPITDHSFENLAPTDQMIARVRRRVLMAARAVADGKAPAPGAQEPEVFYNARAGSFLHNPDDSLAGAYETALAKATRWGKEVEAAE